MTYSSFPVRSSYVFRVGDKVWYRGAWGSEDRTAGKIVGIGEKNGRPVYDVDLRGETWSRWGYAEQFEPRS